MTAEHMQRVDEWKLGGGGYKGIRWDERRDPVADPMAEIAFTTALRYRDIMQAPPAPRYRLPQALLSARLRLCSSNDDAGQTRTQLHAL